MSLGNKWCTLGEATQKYGLDSSLIFKWTEAGVVRAEHEGTRLMQVNADDIELKIHDVTEI
jgi:hypothetical protein